MGAARALIAAFAGIGAAFAAEGVVAQDLHDAVRRGAEAVADSAAADSVAASPPAPWRVVAGEVALGTVFAAGAGYAVGLLAELVCDGCDAAAPGGDAPGIALGVPAGAFLGVWLVGRTFPPPGRLSDTLMGALAGAAVFAGYASLLEGEPDLVRWMGAAAPGAITAMAWNRSRLGEAGRIVAGGGTGDAPRAAFSVVLFEVRF